MKYQHVKIVAKEQCTACYGSGETPRHVSAPQPLGGPRQCWVCGGKGETEQELLHPGEPFLLVRGQDQYAPAMVAVYAALVDSMGGAPAGLDALQARIREWQDDNPGLVKHPD